MSGTSSWLHPSHDVIGPATLRPHPEQPKAQLPPNVVVVPQSLPEGPPYEVMPEVDRRQAIAAARAKVVSAEAENSRAAQALARAQQHVSACTADLATYNDIDDTISANAITALRDGKTPESPPEYLRTRITLRNVAVQTSASADRAAALFATEAADAAENLASARSKLNEAIDCLLGDHAMALLERWRDLTRQRDAIVNALLGLNTAPLPVKAFLHEQIKGGHPLAGQDGAKWKALRDRLSFDPEAKLEL